MLEQLDDPLVKILLVIVFLSLVPSYKNGHISGDNFLEHVCDPCCSA
jgi:hypothetical protein